MTVSVPPMLSFKEEDGNIPVCATMSVEENIERDFVVVLTTLDGTGSYIFKLLVHKG